MADDIPTFVILGQESETTPQPESNTMPEPTDLSANIHNTILTSMTNTFLALQADSIGNIQSASNIVRHVAAKKLDQVDAIESASVKKVLEAQTSGA